MNLYRLLGMVSGATNFTATTRYDTLNIVNFFQNLSTHKTGVLKITKLACFHQT